jgi:hypothetical protein
MVGVVRPGGTAGDGPASVRRSRVGRASNVREHSQTGCLAGRDAVPAHGRRPPLRANVALRVRIVRSSGGRVQPVN